MHGTAYANWAVSGEFRKKQGDQMVQVRRGADLLLAFGVRFDDRVTGNVEKFCEHGTIVHIDIDASEINKNKPANLPMISDIKYALQRLNSMVAERPIQKKFTAWHKQIAAWKAESAFALPGDGGGAHALSMCGSHGRRRQPGDPAADGD